MELDHSSPRAPAGLQQQQLGGGFYRAPAGPEASTRVVLSGYLLKECKTALGCSIGRRWQRRWCEVLEGAVLAYTAKPPSSQSRVMVDLHGAVVSRLQAGAAE
eukprot:COSAG02_NODE_41359_length_395_cov_1.006757_1_plen_102_part_01